MNNFITFIREQGVVGLAIGFILGGSISKVVSSIVNDLVNPLLSILLGKVGDLNELYIQVGEAKFKWGSFINNLIDFVVIASVVYAGTKLLKLDKLDKKPVK